MQQPGQSVNINDSNIGRGGAEGRKVCIWKWWINLTQTGCAWATCDLVSRNGFTNSATKICFDLSIEFYWIVYCLFFTISQVIGYGDRLRKWPKLHVWWALNSAQSVDKEETACIHEMNVWVGLYYNADLTSYLIGSLKFGTRMWKRVNVQQTLGNGRWGEKIDAVENLLLHAGFIRPICDNAALRFSRKSKPESCHNALVLEFTTNIWNHVMLGPSGDLRVFQRIQPAKFTYSFTQFRSFPATAFGTAEAIQAKWNFDKETLFGKRKDGKEAESEGNEREGRRKRPADFVREY